MSIALPELKTGRAAIVSEARIAGVVACVPPLRVTNERFVEQFGDGVAEVTKMTGVEVVRLVEAFALVLWQHWHAAAAWT